MSERYNRIPVAVAALCLGVALGGASAQTASPAASSKPATAAATSKASAAPGGTMAAGDKQFAQKAAMGGMSEVQLGQLAQQKAGNDAVKQFGSRMVQDHGKANDELKQIAGAQGVQLPDSLDKKHMQEMQKLQKLEGAAFDREYMNSQVAMHQWLLNSLDNTLIPSTRSAGFRTWLQGQRTAVATHLDRARRIQSGL